MDRGLLSGGAGSLALLPGFNTHDAFPLALHRDPLALLRTPDRRLRLGFTPVGAHRAYSSYFI